MKSTKKPTKKQLIKMIDEIKSSPHDRVRILGDAGITTVGLVLGAAAAGTLAAAAGATSIAGLTTAASWIGITAVATTPVGWIIGAAVAGGGIAYGVSRMIHGGGMSEGQKRELLTQYTKDLRDIEAKERSGNITDNDKNNFYVSLRELIAKDAITPELASMLIQYVEESRIPISQAIEQVQEILKENKSKPVK